MTKEENIYTVTEAMRYKHPLRDAKIAVYQSVGDNNSPNFLAFIEPMSIYPIRFSADTRESVLTKASEFCTENADKYEATYIARAKARVEAKKKKEAKA